MTTEIEKQFFDTFGIGKVKRRCCSLDSETHCATDYITCEDCSHWIKTEDELDKYPEITDRKLLELFAIDNVMTYEELRNYILCRIIYNYENDENKRCQVKALFEGVE